MNPLDGNAIAGPLFGFYGKEMTAAEGTCRHCGHRGPVAEMRVYVGGPGTVARCPACDGVLLVLTEIRERIEVFSEAFTFDTAARGRAQPE
jgi:Family of unknown function (DUF6510)